jgi:hypothetical protein
MHVLSETWVMSRSIPAEKSGLKPKPTSLLQPVTWVTGKEIGLELGLSGSHISLPQCEAVHTWRQMFAGPRALAADNR